MFIAAFTKVRVVNVTVRCCLLQCRHSDPFVLIVPRFVRRGSGARPASCMRISAASHEQLTVTYLTSCSYASPVTCTSSVCSCSTASSKHVSVRYIVATPTLQPAPAAVGPNFQHTVHIPPVTLSFVRFEVFMAVTMENGVFCDMTPCDSCNRRFGGTQRLHHQGDKNQ
jgi:hypothetical protein